MTITRSCTLTGSLMAWRALAAPCTALLFLCLLFSRAAFAATPSFAAPLALPAQQAPLGITAADFNGDGFQDIAIANAASATVSVYLGSGSGTFSQAATVTLPVGCSAAYIASAKFTGAAQPDLLVVCAMGQLLVLPNTGHGTFGTPRSTTLPLGAWTGNLMIGQVHPAIADFNGDGKLDLVIPGYGEDTVAWYLLLGNGDGTFQTPSSLPFTGIMPLSVVAGDFNGDGKADLVAAAYDSTGTPWLEVAPGNGDGTFQTPVLTRLPATSGTVLLAADVNGDGKLDIVVAGSCLYLNLTGTGGSENNAGVTVLLGDGRGNFTISFDTTEPNYVSDATLAGVLETGRLDLVEATIAFSAASTTPSGAVQIRPNNGDGTFGSPIILPTSTSAVPTDVTTADFNGDGRPDIVTASLPFQPLNLNVSLSSNFSQLLQSVLVQLPSGGADVFLNLTPEYPTITGIGVSGGGTAIAQNTWVSIYGIGLAPASLGLGGLTWSNAPSFNSVPPQMPTVLDGVTVTMNGEPAYIYFVSGAQVNVLTPLDSTTGPVAVTVNNGTDTSAAFTAHMQAVSPGFLRFGDGVHVAAEHADYSYLGPASMSVPGYTFTPAAPGETILLFCDGLGLPASPLTAGSAVQIGVLPTPWPIIQIGELSATVKYAALISPGLYQLNVVVPPLAASGDNQVFASSGGFGSPAGAMLPVSP